MEKKNKTQEIPDLGINLEVTETVKQKEIVGTGVIPDENIYATYPHECKKCGYNKGQLIELGIWFSDEEGVVRVKCGKCGWAETISGKSM